MMSQQDLDGPVELEERFWLEGGGNPGFWRRHFAEDGLVALPLGVMDKAATLQAMQQAGPWSHVEMQDLRVLPIEDASVLVSYRARARRSEDADEYQAVVGSLYLRREGSWQLLFHQQSPAGVPDAR